MMLADLIRDDADENNENVPESAPKRRTRMSNESERKRTRFVPSPSLDGASGERASGGAHEGYGANAMTQDSARFSRYSGVKSPKSAAVLSEEDEDALEDAARALSAARLMRSRSRTATASAAEMRRVNVDASTSVERPVSSGGRRDLEYWGVPETAREALAAKGVRELYPWQTECLALPGVMQGKENLLYSAPTSAGKSLVADVLLMRRFRARPGSIAMFVLPFVALCEERADSLEDLFAGTEFRLRRMYGGRGGTLPNDSSMNTLLVLTPERANHLTSRLLEEDRLHELSAVVIDELHLIQDSDRGATMELFLTKLLYASGLWRQSAIGEGIEGSGDGSQTTFSVGRTRGGARNQRSMQIIGMSASIPNLSSLSEWLFAQLYVTHFRPVRLDICVKVGGELFHAESKRMIRTMLNTKPSADTEHIAELTQETVDEQGSVLIFCSSRKACQLLAEQLRKMVLCAYSNRLGESREQLLRDVEGALGAKSEVLPFMRDGIAYHHAGLSREEGEAVAGAYKRGIVRVLCCTSTLATGVNLPARRVILRDTNMGWKKLNARDIQQMVGRAGRAGLDTTGSAIIFCRSPAEFDNVCSLINGPCEELTSAVAEVGMRRIMLEAVAAGLVKTPTDVQTYIKSTLLSVLNDFDESVKQTAIAALQWCQKNALLVWNATAYLWSASPLGLAVAGGMMPLDQIQPIISDIKAAREDLVLSTPLHLLFLLTSPPVLDDAGVPLNADKYKNGAALGSLWSSLRQDQLRIAEKVGIDERYVYRLGSNKRDVTPAHAVQRFACQRFTLALVLTELVNEVPIETISRKYSMSVYNIMEEQKTCARFASYVAAICGTLGWGDMEGLINRISDRITAGAQEEILELTKIPHIGIHRARALYMGGITTPKAIVTLGSIDKIAAVLKQYNKNDMTPAAIARAAREILLHAKEIVAEQTRAEREEAEARLAEICEIEADMTNENVDATIELDVQNATGVVLLETEDAVGKFLEAWEASNYYAVIFQPKSDDDVTRSRQAFEEPARLAVAFSPKAVFISKILYARHEQKNADGIGHHVIGVPIKRALDILSKVGPKKFTVDLQSQLCNIVQEQANSYDSRLFSFAAPCVDVRIASWLLRPSAHEVMGTARSELVQGKDPTERLLDLFSDELLGVKGMIDGACVLEERRERKLNHLKPLARATATCLAISEFIWNECDEKGVMHSLLHIEMPFVSPIVAMETVRVPFDAQKMRAELSLMDDRLEALEQCAEDQKWLDGTLPNIRRAFTDNDYLMKCLYEHLKLTPPEGSLLPLTKTGKTRKRMYSIDQGNLQELHQTSGHLFPLLIMEHRSIFKRRGFADSILGMYSEENRIRYSIFQTNHDCGRLAHTEPNFHSLAHDIRCSDAFQGLGSPQISIRSAFVPPAEKMFLRADYSQLELRVMAHLSGDQTLTQMLLNPEPQDIRDDPFTILASKWHRVLLESVKNEERQQCKNLVYGILYGSGVKRLARELRLSETEAKTIVDQLKGMLPRLMTWKDEIIVRAKEAKPMAHVQTISARRRYLPDLHSKNNDERAQAERQAVNTVCQGSAADIFKTAVLLVIDTLRAKFLLERCQLVLTVHDECVFEVDARSAKAIAQVVRTSMESVAKKFSLTVPLPVKIHIGPSLSDAAFTVVPRPSALSRQTSARATPASSPRKPTTA